MLAYAPHRSAKFTRSPGALTLVLAGHAIAIAIVLTARGQMPMIQRFDPTDIIFIDPAPPPPPPTPPAEAHAPKTPSLVDSPPVIVPVRAPSDDAFEPGPVAAIRTPVEGVDLIAPPTSTLLPPAAPVRQAARFATPPDDVRPPYPESKRRLEEEASLRLSLSIDASGRVVAVEPVGNADPIFLDAARRHILRRWRYRPAMEDGHAMPSEIAVTLKFELDRY